MYAQFDSLILNKSVEGRPCIITVVAGRSHVPMEKTAFEGWLESVSATFLTLNDQQRNHSLDHLISLSGAAQLRHLSNGLETLLKRDFLRLLPLELAFYLMRWLDPQTLLTCCLVCKQWNKVNVQFCKLKNNLSAKPGNMSDGCVLTLMYPHV